MEAHLIQIQLDNTHIRVNHPENNSKIGGTDSPQLCIEKRPHQRGWERHKCGWELNGPAGLLEGERNNGGTEKGEKQTLTARTPGTGACTGKINPHNIWL